MSERPWSISTWSVTFTVRGSSHRFTPGCLDELAYLEPTITAASQPNGRIITLIVKAASADTALGYGHHRIAQALTAAGGAWRIASPGTVRRIGRPDTANLDLAAAGETRLARA